MSPTPPEALPASLVDGLRRGTVIPFVGAGISSGVVSIRNGERLYPSWRKLLELAADRLDREALPTDASAVRALLSAERPDFYAAADRAWTALGTIWAALLKEVLDPERNEVDTESLEAPRALWRLGSPLLITTNYDRVLYWAHPSPLDVQRWVLEAPAEHAALLRHRLKRPTIWHLHGHIDDVASLVLTGDGYRKLYGDETTATHFPAAKATLEALLAGRSLLFVGFSFEDAVFRRMFEDVWRRFKGFGGPHYVIARGKDADGFAALLGDSTRVVRFEDFGKPFLELLARLGASVGSPAWRLTPAYESVDSERLSVELLDLFARRRRLTEAGHSSVEVQQRIQEIQRILREGGTLKAGDCLDDGRYVLVERKGAGGFGVVWLAADRVRGVQVAIKVLHPEDARQPQRRERFYRGARSMESIHDDNAVTRGRAPREEASWHYYVMEYVAGGDLQSRGCLPYREVVALVLKIGRALHAAHRLELIHRDVKPGNILLDAQNEPKLTDFDLVKTQTSIAKTRAEALGAYGYAAPEALRDGSNVDARADVYSLGMTMLFLLIGPDLALEDFAERASQLSRLDVPEGVKAILRRATALSVASRPGSAQEFCRELELAATLGGPSELKTPSRAGEADRSQRLPAPSRAPLATTNTRDAAPALLESAAFAPLPTVLDAASGALPASEMSRSWSLSKWWKGRSWNLELSRARLAVLTLLAFVAFVAFVAVRAAWSSRSGTGGTLTSVPQPIHTTEKAGAQLVPSGSGSSDSAQVLRGEGPSVAIVAAEALPSSSARAPRSASSSRSIPSSRSEPTSASVPPKSSVSPKSSAELTLPAEYPETVRITNKQNGTYATGFFAPKAFLIAPSVLFEGGNEVVAKFADESERPVELYKKAKTLPFAQLRLVGAPFELMAFTAKFVQRVKVRLEPSLTAGERLELLALGRREAVTFLGMGAEPPAHSRQVLIFSARSRPGDMGAPVLDDQNRVVGVLAGQTPQGAYAASIKDVVDELPE